MTKQKLFYCAVFLFLSAAVLYAQTPQTRMIRGSVGGGGQKTYGPFPVSSGGTSLIHLTFDNPSTDLDLAVALTGDSGIEPFALSLSGIRQFETLIVGIPVGNQFYVQVISASGSSPFRLTIECACTESASGAPGIVSETAILELESRPEFERIADRARKLKRTKP